MLATLRVKNLALVDNVCADFQSGLNVVTGETGAGKSILIGALSLLVGERADKRVIRSGEDACGVEALFQLADSTAVDAALEESGMTPCDHGQLIVRRIVKASGANQILINDSPATLQVLKKIGDLLVDLHGPHDHQSLLSSEFQLDLLDAWGHLREDREACAEVYRRLAELRARREELSRGDADVPAQMDLLSYRIKEIEQADLVEGEEEKIEQEHILSGNAQRIHELGGAAAEALQESDASVFNLLVSAQRSLDELSRLMPDALAWRDEVRAAAAQVQALAAAVRGALDSVEADPARLVWLDERIAVYQKMRRKYAPTVAETLAILEESRTRLNDLKTRGEQLEVLGREMAGVEKKLHAKGEVLSRKRAEAAVRLAGSVTEELRALGFAHGAFTVGLAKTEPGPSGSDAAEFGFAPNAGEPAHPLRMIASSGEISRVMLAIKVSLAGHDRIPVLVFDEIDANVGGEMGNAVGRKLSEVARTHQVICVTHLPQVAAHGSAHLAVTKSVRGGRTFTGVQALDHDGRVEEIARMLGGRDLTPVTLKHAKEMLSALSGGGCPGTNES